jgi:co-chaperonin GroES (HSP10)
MEIIPLQDYVLLEEIHSEILSSIILPDNPDIERSNRCKIISKGEKVLLAVGETVLIKPHMFDEIEIDKKKYLIGREESIIARIL